MTEKRFIHINMLGNPTIWDKKEDKKYIQYDEETTDEIVDLLNKQNNKLNQTLNILEEADIFSEEALKNDSFAYREMRKFDNKDAYAIALAIKSGIKVIKDDRKRFERWNNYSCKVKDNQEDTFLNCEDVANKLNEQQVIIEQLKKDKTILNKRLRECGMRVDKLSNNCR